MASRGTRAASPCTARLSGECRSCSWKAAPLREDASYEEQTFATGHTPGRRGIERRVHTGDAAPACSAKTLAPAASIKTERLRKGADAHFPFPSILLSRD